MKIVIPSLIILLALQVNAQQNETPFQENNNHLRGEQLSYKIKYGWFKIGEADVTNDSQFHYINGEPHYKVNFNLRTVGWLKIFANLNLEFESYLNAKTFKPHRALRALREGKRENIQHDKFRYQDSIYVETYREDKDETRITTYPVEGPDFTDALGAYMYVRGQALNMEKNETLRFYIANRVFGFDLLPKKEESKKNQKHYELLFPPIKQFPRDKTSYAILDENRNIPLEVKLSTDNGNFYLLLDD